MQHSVPSEYFAVHKTHLDPIRQMLAKGKPDGEEKNASLDLFVARDAEDRPYDLIKTVAVLPLRGYLFKRGWGWWWGTSFDYFSDMVRLAANDYAVDTILIDAESPGGGVNGCPDCSDVLYEVAKRKRVIMVVNDLCASACLWVGSAASEIVITQSGEMGSIGVYQMRFDYTEALKKEGIGVDIIRAGEQKAWGSPYLPMTPEERAVTQAEVDKLYDQFIAAVARNRDVDPDKVRNEWADARMFSGADAVRVGLADRVASFDQVLAELVGRDVITGDSSDGQQSNVDRDSGPSVKRRWTGTIRR